MKDVIERVKELDSANKPGTTTKPFQLKKASAAQLGQAIINFWTTPLSG